MDRPPRISVLYVVCGICGGDGTYGLIRKDYSEWRGREYSREQNGEWRVDRGGGLISGKAPRRRFLSKTK
jgi:hypothetical protein